MRIGDRRRVLVWAIIAAIALGFLFGWYFRIWLEPTPESRIRGTADEIRDRVHAFTH
jgi:hypothetical protein